MKSSLIDTSVIVRYLVEDPQNVSEKFKGVFPFFGKVEFAEIIVELPELVVFETFFVLTKLYQVPPKEAAKKLQILISLKGIIMHDKHLMQSSLEILQSKRISLVDSYILATSQKKEIQSVYTYDSDFSKYGLKLLEIK